ncbi:hypothetical protein [Streptomyces sp. DSM 40750]|uniref:hypothetical protein n=1 Tax=Streptomyces sp. DSM 40750 TaxID=2801030 RepID=UPI00214CB08D|nr:hypothetical protein [Streptomyces sp. DSM 40750]UUU22179.1 hypothetical protein JIX55_18725 [Streptomyces sp. DSM 40750]
MTDNNESARTHWLYEWIDAYNIKSRDDLLRHAEIPATLERLHDIATKVPAWHAKPAPQERSIVAGGTLDLSGRITCGAAACAKKRIDRIFGQIWHYFDSIVVEGPSARSTVRALETMKKRERPAFFFTLWEEIDLLLYARKIGIVDNLVFREKPHAFCDHHLRENAAEAGIAAAVDGNLRKEIAKELKKSSTIQLTPEGDAWRYFISNPEFSETFSGRYRHSSKKGAKPSKQQAAEAAVRRCSAALVFDAAMSRKLGLPLVQEFSFLWPNQSMTEDPESLESRVALQLPLPVLQGLAARDIVRFRADHKPHFERFQHALTEAIREQADRVGTSSPANIAAAVNEDFIRPAMADIERSMIETKRLFGTKSGTSIAVGTAIAGAGILSSIPLVIASGLGAAVTVTLASANSYLDSKKDAKLSDVYFLWKATKMHNK